MFKEIFDSSPVALVLVDTNRKIKIINKQAEILFGYSKKELEGQFVELLVPSSSKSAHPKLFAGYLDSPLPRLMGGGRTLNGLKKDGIEFPIEVGLNPIQVDNKVFILSSIIDISERLKAEEKFRTAIEAAPNAMIMIDERGTIVLVNQLTEMLFGYTRKEMLGSPVELLVPEEVKKFHPTFVKSYTENPVPRAMGSGRDLFAQKKDGTRFPVEIGLRPFRNDDGLYIMSSIVDISERVKNRQALLSRNEELEQFSYRTSHDLKAPLISIIGLAEYIIEDLEAGEKEEAVQNVRKIISISKKLNQLVADILQLTKTDYINEEHTAVNLKEVLVTAKEKLSYLAEENNVEMRFELAHTKPLLTQKTRFTLIIDNLISNAIKYSDPLKEKKFVCVKTSNDDISFKIEFIDNGKGIPERKEKEVFGIFKRFHSDSNPGSGLGLYLVKKQVEKLGGIITFKTVENQGTTFTITFSNR